VSSAQFIEHDEIASRLELMTSRRSRDANHAALWILSVEPCRNEARVWRRISEGAPLTLPHPPLETLNDRRRLNKSEALYVVRSTDARQSRRPPSSNERPPGEQSILIDGTRNNGSTLRYRISTRIIRNLQEERKDRERRSLSFRDVCASKIFITHVLPEILFHFS